LFARLRVAASVAVVAVMVLLAPGVERTGLAQETPSGWTPIGPPGPGVVASAALSPDWSRDPFLIVKKFSQPGIFRSMDGGANWEELAHVAGSGLAVRTGPDGTRLVFISDTDQGVASLKRSADGGLTWQTVFSREVRNSQIRDATVSFSPAFAQDGLAFVFVGGEVTRSRDAGRTWEPIAPAPGQWLGEMRFSPDFARDRTAYLAASDPAQATQSDRRDEVGMSRGVMVSTDGGESWSVLPSQPEIDGASYRAITHLTVSPTFAEDGTLAAYAFGPPTPPSTGSTSTPNSALFISRDRGVSWTPVDRRTSPTRVEVAFSPNFSTDRTMLFGTITYPLVALSPGSQSCSVQQSTDGGLTWGHGYSKGDSSCFGLSLLARDGWLLGLVGTGGARSGISRVVSLDAGRTWNVFLPPPPGGNPNFTNVTVSPGFSEDGAIFVSSASGGLWQYAPLPCPIPMIGGFQRIWESDPSARDDLACPSTPEQKVRVRERRYTETVNGVEVARHAYWPEDDNESWIVTWQSDSGEGCWTTEKKEAKPWPSEPDAVLDGSIQRFGYSAMLWLSHPDGRRSILVLSSARGRFWELPD
jgi:hypothetical protein